MGCSRVLVLQIEIQSQTFELKKILLQYTVLITKSLRFTKLQSNHKHLNKENHITILIQNLGAIQVS